MGGAMNVSNSPILQALLIIVVIGLVVWVLNTYTPIPDPFKKIILAIGVVAALIVALAAFGVHF